MTCASTNGTPSMSACTNVVTRSSRAERRRSSSRSMKYCWTPAVAALATGVRCGVPGTRSFSSWVQCSSCSRRARSTGSLSCRLGMPIRWKNTSKGMGQASSCARSTAPRSRHEATRSRTTAADAVLELGDAARQEVRLHHLADLVVPGVVHAADGPRRNLLQAAVVDVHALEAAERVRVERRRPHVLEAGQGVPVPPLAVVDGRLVPHPPVHRERVGRVEVGGERVVLHHGHGCGHGGLRRGRRWTVEGQLPRAASSRVRNGDAQPLGLAGRGRTRAHHRQPGLPPGSADEAGPPGQAAEG